MQSHPRTLKVVLITSDDVNRDDRHTDCTSPFIIIDADNTGQPLSTTYVCSENCSRSVTDGTDSGELHCLAVINTGEAT